MVSYRSRVSHEFSGSSRLSTGTLGHDYLLGCLWIVTISGILGFIESGLLRAEESVLRV